MKYLKLYESYDNKEDIVRREYEDFDKVSNLIKDLIFKFGIDEVNEIRVSDIDRNKGEVKMQLNKSVDKFSYTFQVDKEILPYYYNLLEKYNFRKSPFLDIYSTKTFDISIGEYTVDLWTPRKKLIGGHFMGDIETLTYRSEYKYKGFKISGDESVYFNINDAEKMIKHLKEITISNIEKPGRIYDISKILKKINK